MPGESIQYSEKRDLPAEQVVALYRAAAWSAAQKPDLLVKGLANSDGVITAWPTKLALAPRLADEVEKLLVNVKPGDPVAPIDWPHPPCAVLPWQENEKWN